MLATSSAMAFLILTDTNMSVSSDVVYVSCLYSSVGVIK